MHEQTPNTSAGAQTLQLRSYLDRHRGELFGMLGRAGYAGLALARRHSKIMDGLLTTLYPIAFSSSRATRRPPVMLGAVGGYGRELLALKSDLDVRLVTNASPEAVQALAEALLYPLWDAGVSIGHQVISVADAVNEAEHDLPTATALLDFRPIAGDAATALELQERAYAGPFSRERLPAFMQRLEAEVADRHQRFGDSLYLLEPDVKNAPGGLRDLDVALWAVRARFRTADFGQLMREGVLVAREAEDMHGAVEFFWALRNHLHQHAGRRSDRLTFDEQEQIALAMGYRDRIGIRVDAAVEDYLGPMVEAFMSDYYRHARVVARAREQLIARATPSHRRSRSRKQDLGGGLCCLDGLIGLADAEALQREPALALRLYVEAVARHAGVQAGARDAVARAAADPLFGTALRASGEAASLFVSLLCDDRAGCFRSGSIVSELHAVGLLVAMVPEFLPVVGRVHHDVYHVYTVDVHSIAAVDRLHAMTRGELQERYPLACRLAPAIAHRQVLCLATLLHDVGKLIGCGDHARRGANLARQVFARLGFSREHTAAGVRLIEQHLLMYFVATRRDLAEPHVIVDFVRQLRGREMLRELYLLTVVDVSTTAPESLTEWKARMLDELFTASDVMLSGLEASAAARIANVRAEVRRLWDSGPGGAFLDEFVATMPQRYLLANTPAEIVAHARVAQAVRGRDCQVTAKLVPSRHSGVAELCIVAGVGAGAGATDRILAGASDAGLCVVAGDRPGLLAAVTAAIAASRLEIHAAQIHSRQLPDGSMQAVDVFWVRDRADGEIGVERALAKLEIDLEKVIAGQVSPGELVTQPAPSRWSERPSPRVATEVLVDERTSLEHTIVEVMTKDRPGLLYTLADAMHGLGLSIATAKIHTEGNRVVDVFYVNEIDGTKLTAGRRTEEVRQRLLAALSN